MKTDIAPRLRLRSSTFAECVGVGILALFVLALIEPGFAQPEPPRSGGGVPNFTTLAGPGPTAESSSSPPQYPQSDLPNAPSSAKQQYLPIGSLTLADRFRIYRMQILRPYTLVGRHSALASGNGKTSPRRGDKEERATPAASLLGSDGN